MPFDSEGLDDSIALCLSGGGYRAALFHVGTLWRLNELGILSQLGRVSSVSGGSITAGVLATRWTRLQFDENRTCGNYVDQVVLPLREFCSKTLDVWATIKGGANPFKTAGDYVIDAYRNSLGLSTPLTSLPDSGPRFVFNSTNLKTGSTFRFSKLYCGDYRIGLAKDTGLDVATAVGCSSAFPPVLSPIEFKLNPEAFERTVGADLFDEVDYRTHFSLADGGVYDNLGLETAWKRCRTVLVSDAGKPFSVDDSISRLWPSQLSRVMDIGLNQALALRKRVLIADLEAKARLGAYWGINTPIHRYPIEDVIEVSDATVASLSEIRTRLDHFTAQEQRELINWGYAVCDAAVRSRYHNGGPCGDLPYPDYPLH